MVKKNIIKGWITSIIGVVTMVLTLFLVYMDQMDFVWNGVAGLSIGVILLMAPRTIEKYFVRFFESMSGKNTSNESEKEENKNSRKD